MRSSSLLLTLLVLTAMNPASGSQIYKCVGHDGQVAFQDTPCKSHTLQQVMQIQNDVSRPTNVPAHAAEADSPAPAPSTPKPVRPRPQVTLLYRCVRATDGSTYISRDGHPQPYLAPLGIVGMGQQPLAQVYGGAQNARAGSSTPGLAPHATPAMIGSNYTEVRDRCLKMGAEETCRALQDEYDANEEKLRNAFDSDKPPFLKREKQLQQQMAGCSD